MFKIFRYIGYAFQAKKGFEKPDELVSEISFGFIELYFILSFVFFGMITLGLGFLGFRFNSSVLQIFAVLFLLTLSIDIFVYIRVKRFFKNISTRVVDISKKAYQDTKSYILEKKD